MNLRSPNVSIPHLLVKVLAVWGVLTFAIVFAATFHDPVSRAVMGMAGGLSLLWIILGGSIMYTRREDIKNALHITTGWRKKFVFLCTLLALIEEAITTTMTNVAPLFGVKVGEAYITASTNYLDVVLLHSVVVFVPMFAAWALLLSRYAFTPVEVFLLFGFTGTLAEAFSYGLQNLGSVGFWVFVYGLMVYLPAYVIPQERGAKRPLMRHYVLAVFLPFLFAVPVAAVVSVMHPVKTHFEGDLSLLVGALTVRIHAVD